MGSIRRSILILLIAFVGSALSLPLSAMQPQPDSTGQSAESDLPLTPERTISFTTDAGTWMSLDISPNGKTIVFDMMGDLYSIPIEGGKATQLTDGMAFDSHPRYSPDGTNLLFASDRDGAENIWYMNLENETFHQVTRGNDNTPNAEWTPDGEYIVVAQGRRTPKLKLYHKDGGTGVSLIKEPDGLKTIDPAISPDGRYIYYSRRFGAWNYNAQLPQYQIGVYDREHGETTTITSRHGSAFTPVTSPDGKWLVYGTRFEDQTGLVMRNLDNGEERWMAYPVQRDDQESKANMGVYPGMSFTPDSRHLLAYFGGKIWKLPVGEGEAQQVPFEVDINLEMGPQLDFAYPISDDKQVTATQIRDAVPSPDGEQLAFTVLNKLYVMDYPDGEPRRLTDLEHIEAQPAWSPDGQWITFATWGPEGGHLYRVAPDNRRPTLQKLTKEPALYAEPAYSLNRDRIVFLKGSAYQYDENISPFAYFSATDEIAWIPDNGGDATLVAKSSGLRNPHFTQSDDRIYLNDSGGELVSMRWDGTDRNELAKITGITTYGPSIENEQHPDAGPREDRSPSSAGEITMAPDGKKALAKINNYIYQVTIPRVGEMVKISVKNPDRAQFPAGLLTEMGGEFPAWSSDSKKVHYSLGNAHFVYNLDEAKQFRDSLKAAGKDSEGENAEQNGEDEDTPNEEDQKEMKKERYHPEEHRVEVIYNRDIPEGTLLLSGARVITMNGDQILHSGDILVTDNRITAVGVSGTLAVPEGTPTMDMTGKTIIPGLVDTHAHMWPTWSIHKNQVWNYAANLAYGVTTTRDPQTSTTDVLTYADMVDAGMMLGPRIYSTGPGIGYFSYHIRSLDHARDVMRQYSEYYDTKTIKMYVAGNRKIRQWLLMAAKEQKIMPTTEGTLDFKLNMTQLIDGYPGHEHSFPIYPIYDEVVRITAESQMAVTPTLLVSYGGPFAENYYYARDKPYNDPKLSRFTPYSELASKARRRGFWAMEEEHVFQKHARFMNDLVKAGGIAGIGSHGQLEGLGYHWELWSVQSGGMDNHDALRVATLLGAKALGLDGDLGSIEEGKLADLVILNRNPLENIRNTNSVRYVMKNGRLYDGNTLDQVHPLKREAGPFWWKQDKPKSRSLPGVKEQ